MLGVVDAVVDFAVAVAVSSLKSGKRFNSNIISPIMATSYIEY